MKLRSALPPVLVAVVGLGILSGLQNSGFRESIEAELTERAQGALSAEGLDDVDVEVIGRDAAVTAASDSTARAAVGVLDDVDGLRTAVVAAPHAAADDDDAPADSAPADPGATDDGPSDEATTEPSDEPSDEPTRTPTSEERDEAQDDLVEIPNITFVTDSARLTEDGHRVVRHAADVLAEHPEVEVRIEGHTDSRGSESYNRWLSGVRAEQVLDELVELGVEEDRLTAKGFGESDPVVPKTSDDLEKNRRVEFSVQN